jgi:hypothetical protein
MQPEHNFNKAASYIRSAASQGAELAVLPEYHLTSWVPKDPGFVDFGEQWEVYLNKYQELARECGICIVPGTIVESHRGAEREEDRLVNVAYFIDMEGRVVGKYVKKNLWYALFRFGILCFLLSLRVLIFMRSSKSLSFHFPIPWPRRQAYANTNVTGDLKESTSQVAAETCTRSSILHLAKSECWCAGTLPSPKPSEKSSHRAQR